MSLNTSIILNAIPAFIILALAESIALSLEHKNKDETFAPHYGLTKKMDSYNPFYITFSEWINIFSDLKKVKDFRNGWMCLFGSPSWKPDTGQKKDSQSLFSTTVTEIMS